MIIEFKTLGSTYRIDGNNMTWERLTKTVNSGEIRQESGTLLAIPAVRIGEGVIIRDSKVLPGMSDHIVYTSNVVEFTESL